MTSSLKFNHCIILLKRFSNSSLDTDSIQIHPKNYLLGFFLCFLHFLFQFLLDFLFRKDREHFQNSICSLETEQSQRHAKPWLALTEITQGLQQPPLQLDSRAPHYLHGRPKSCLFGLWQEWLLGLSLPAWWIQLCCTLRGAMGKEGEEFWSGRPSDLLKQTQKSTGKRSHKEKKGKWTYSILVEQPARII